MLSIARLHNLIREIAEVFSPAQRRFGHEFQRLASVPAFAQSNLFCARLDPFSDLDQDLLTLKRRHIAPLWKCIRRRVCRRIDIFCCPMCDIANQRLIHR